MRFVRGYQTHCTSIVRYSSLQSRKLSIFCFPAARASCYQCDTQYRGPLAQSELETQAITASVQALRKTLRAYITVHSYSQMWLTRWGYSQDATDDHEVCL